MDPFWPPMNIAYLMPTYPMPSQTFIRREVAALESRGIKVHRFAARPYAGELADRADRAEHERTTYLLQAGAWGLLGAFVAEAAARPRRWLKGVATAFRLGRRSELGLLWHLIYLAEACLLRRRLTDCGASHLHVHFGTNAASVALLCRQLGGPPYSITIHGPEEFDSPRQLSLRDKVHDAAFVACISEFTCSQLYRWTDSSDRAKIHTIHCGLDALFLSAAWMPVPERPRLVNVGRLSIEKGHFLLIEAAARLHAQGTDFELVIVGDGGLRGELEGQIDEHGLRGRVRITGFLDNHGVRAEIEAARALVVSSFAEGLPVVVMEALALGRPVISTSIAGIPELVEPGLCGWLVPAGSVGALAAAMDAALAASPTELEAMGRAGAARVAERYSVAIEAQKLADLIGTSPAVAAGCDSHADPVPALVGR